MDISFITINYNGIQETCEMIDSLKNVLQSVSYEIIVVDNASKNDEADRLIEKYKDQIVVIKSKENKGFAGGNNLALSVAKGKYLFFINNDTFVEEDGMHSLVERLESSDKIGMVCPKLRFSWDNRPIQFAGFTPLSRVTLRNSGIGCGEDDRGQYDKAHPTPFAHGAAMMVKREVLENVGPMYEGYFLYYEEMDWSSRITEGGYEIWYEPRCTVFHKESMSTGRVSPLKTYYMTRNRLLFARRNRKGLSKLLCYMYLTSVAVLRDIPKHILTHRKDLAASTYKGLKDFYKM